MVVNKNKQKITDNITVPNKDLEVLKRHFSHCFDKNGNFDFEKFKKELSKNEMDFSKESYGMDWLGKSYARLLANDEATTLLKEDEEFNKKQKNKNSENLLIKGDNLEVLKHLSNAYYEKVKMIYIDPPYNTGSDGFVYQDDRKFTYQELSKLAGIDEEKAKRILEFTQSKSNSHSAWLTFMYPRLYIAKQLLKDDGVIFVSIDDNEVAQLRLLMDEIFGEENFIATFVRKTGIAPRLDATHVSIEQDYVLCYSKNANLTNLNKQLSNSDEGYMYKDKFVEKRGKYKLNKLDRGSIRYSSSLDYPMEAPDGTLIYPGGTPKKNNWCWRWSKDKSERGIKNDFIVFKKDKNNQWKVYFKQYQYVDNNDKPLIRKLPFKTLLIENYNNELGSKEIEKLFAKKVFSYPKPVNLIKHLIKIATNKSENEIILDFFAGSGTTGDAVMQLNAEDGGNRKYILVQLPEEIDEKKNKTAYDFVKNELGVENPTIFDICKERLIRAGKKIKEENKDKDLSNVDFGFKIFETTPIWEDYNFEAEEFDPQQKLFDESKLTEEDLKTLLTTWKTYDGIPLTEDLKGIDLDRYKGYYFDNKLYLVNKGFTTKNLKKLLEEIDKNPDFNPAIIIAFGYNFESKALREIAENVKNYANKKQVDIDFIIRY